MNTRTRRVLPWALAVLAAALAMPSAQAANYYWDTDGTTLGLGNATGTWGTSSFVATFPSNAALTGNLTTANTATTSADAMYFGTNNLSLGPTASTIGIAAGGVTINTIAFGSGQTNAVTLSSGGGTITLAGTAPSNPPTISVNTTTANATIGAVLAGTVGMVKAGPGTLVLTGTNSFTGGLTIAGGGTLLVGNGTSGNLTSQALTFNNGGGLFNVQSPSAGSTQAMGALTFSATGVGDSTVQSSYGSSGNASLTFTSLAARGAGATGTFQVSGGSNGTTNKIVLTGATTGTLLDRGLFFGGSNYAAYDAAGFVRAFGSGDTNYLAAPTGATMGSPTSTSNVELTTGNITAQTTASANTINMGANSIAMSASSQTLSVNGLLSSGSGSAMIGGGASVTPGLTTATGSAELVVRVNGSSDQLTIAANIANNGTTPLTKSGAGTLVLTGTNTYTGSTTISGGTLAASGGFAIADTGAVVLANAPGATFRLDSNETIGNLSGGGFSSGNVNVGTNTLVIADNTSTTFAGQFIGTGGVTKTGTGTLTLSNLNTFAGTFTLSGGSLTLTYGDNGTATPSPLSSGGLVSLASGTSLNFSPSANVAGGIGATTLLNNVGGASFANAISVTSGTAIIRTAGQGGANDWGWTFGGNVTGGTSGSQVLSLQVAGLSAGGGGDRQNLRFAGVISDGTGGSNLGVTADFLSASGVTQEQEVNLSGQNTFSGPIVVLNSRNSNFSYSGPTAANSGNYFAIGGLVNRSFASGRTVTVGTGSLGTTAPGTGNFSNTISLANGTALNYVSSANQTLSGEISGRGNLIMDRTAGSSVGTLTLTAANTFRGVTVVNNGILVLGNSLALQNSIIDATNSTAGNATIGLRTALSSLTIGGLTGNKDLSTLFTTSSGGYSGITALTLNPVAGASNTYSGNISGTTMSVTKTGLGTQTVSGANSTYTGGTNVNAGTLLWSGAANLPTTGTLQVNGGGNFSLADGTARTTSTARLGLADGATLTFDWNAGSVDQLTSTAAAVATTGVVGIQINNTSPSGAGGTLISSASGGLTANGTVYLLANNTNYTATISSNDTNVSIGAQTSTTALTNAYWLGNQVTGALGSMALSNGSTSNWASAASGTSANGVVPGGSAVNVIFGTTGGAQQANVSAGAAMNLNSLNFNDGTAVTIAGPYAITLNSSNATAASTAGANSTLTAGSAISVTSFASATNTINASLVLGASQTWNVASGKTLNVGGEVTGAFSVTKADAGTVVLSGTNTFSGGLAINAGTVQLGSAGALNNIATQENTVTFGASSTGTLALAGNSVTIANLTTNATPGTTFVQNANGSAVSNVTLTVGNALNLGGTFAGNIRDGSGGGTLSFTKAGLGTLVLSNATSSYTGTTAINGGTLSVSTLANGNSTSSIGSSSSVATNLILNGGALTYTGAGNSTDRLFSLQSSSTINASGSGAVNFTGNGTMGFNGSTAAKALTLTGTNTASNTLASLIANNTGATSVVKDGVGQWVLSNAGNSYTGGTSVNAGTMTYASKTAFGTGPITLAGGSTLQKITEEGNSASLAMSNNMTLSGGQVTLNVDFSAAKDQWFTGVISGSGSLRVLGGGGVGRSATFAGNNTFTGGVTLETSGVSPWIQLGHSAGLGTGTLTVRGTSAAQAQGLGAATALTSGSGVTNNIVINSGATLNLGGPGATGNVLLSGIISGAGALNKTDVAATTFILSGNNTYTGATTISTGTLAVNGSLANTAVTVSSGGRLQGNGSVVGPVTINGGGTLATGNSIESLATGALTLGSNSTFAYEIDNDAAPSVAGDLTAVTGNLTLDLGNASLLTITELGSGSWTAGEKLTLISYSTGGWNGGLFTYNASTLLNNSTFTFSGTDWLFKYDDTSPGTNFTADLTTPPATYVTMVAVPEPTTMALFGASVVLLGLRLARRRA